MCFIKHVNSIFRNFLFYDQIMFLKCSYDIFYLPEMHVFASFIYRMLYTRQFSLTTAQFRWKYDIKGIDYCLIEIIKGLTDKG